MNPSAATSPAFNGKPSTSGPASTRGQRALGWWQRLRDPKRGNAGTLAQLRRCRSTVEAVTIHAAVSLARQLGASHGDSPDWHTRASLDLARVLAHAKEHDSSNHPMCAAGWKEFPGSQKESELPAKRRPVLSEVRFKRLLQTSDGEEKITAFVRLIALLGGKVKVDTLAEDFLLWNHPVKGDWVRERWAFSYYAASSAAPSAPTATDTEDDEV